MGKETSWTANQFESKIQNGDVVLWSLASWTCEFKFRRRHGCLYLVSVLCFQVVSTTSRSLVQGSRIEGSLPRSVIVRNNSLYTYNELADGCQNQERKENGRLLDLRIAIDFDRSCEWQVDGRSFWACRGFGYLGFEISISFTRYLVKAESVTADPFFGRRR